MRYGSKAAGPPVPRAACLALPAGTEFSVLDCTALHWAFLFSPLVRQIRASTYILICPWCCRHYANRVADVEKTHAADPQALAYQVRHRGRPAHPLARHATRIILLVQASSPSLRRHARERSASGAPRRAAWAAQRARRERGSLARGEIATTGRACQEEGVHILGGTPTPTQTLSQTHTTPTHPPTHLHPPTNPRTLNFPPHRTPTSPTLRCP